MTIWLAVGGVVVALWVLVHLKSGRSDGTLVPRVHPYRRMMQLIMPTRNESVVYFDDWIEAERLEAFVKAARGRFDCDVTHVVVGAVAVALAENPNLNRFVSGHRLYQRNHIAVSFAMKRKKLDAASKLAVVKVVCDPKDSFGKLCERIDAQVGENRSDARTADDKELDLLSVLPRPLLRAAVAAIRWLDYHNLMPAFFLEHDKLYTSVFVANLGSLGMGAAFHHLYEYGNCPLFLMVGRIEERPVAVEGAVVARRMLHVRWSFDERIDDGLNARHGLDCLRRVLADPFTTLGCVAEGDTDVRAIGEIRTRAG